AGGLVAAAVLGKRPAAPVRGADNARENQALTVVNEPIADMHKGLPRIGNGFRERGHGTEVGGRRLVCSRNRIRKPCSRPIVARGAGSSHSAKALRAMSRNRRYE